jgi:hypothetical protein
MRAADRSHVTTNSQQTTEGAMANNSKKNEIRNSNDQTVEVLYQKMGNRWFAFSLIDEEVFVGSISQDELENVTTEQSNAPAPRDQNIGNS